MGALGKEREREREKERDTTNKPFSYSSLARMIFFVLLDSYLDIRVVLVIGVRFLHRGTTGHHACEHQPEHLHTHTKHQNTSFAQSASLFPSSSFPYTAASPSSLSFFFFSLLFLPHLSSGVPLLVFRVDNIFPPSRVSSQSPPPCRRHPHDHHRALTYLQADLP